MVIITATPLSEMVWSQREGLSIQYVTSNLAEKKAAVLWNTESFSIVISSPKRTNIEDASNSKDRTESDPSLLQLKHSREEGTSYTVRLQGSPLCKNREEDSRTTGDLKLSSREDTDVDMQNLEINEPAGEADKSCGILGCDTDAIGEMGGTNLVSGSLNHGQGAELSNNLKELSPEFNCEADVGSSPNRMKASDRTKTCSVDNNLSTKHENLAPDTAVGSSFQFGSHIPFARQLDGQLRASQKGKCVLVASPSVDITDYPNKGKEKVISETQSTYSSTSNNSGDSNDSVESSSSKRVISAGKRERSYNLNPNISAENRRLKRRIIGGSSSGSFARQNSSFMNWVSAITDGFFKFSDATPLACAPPPPSNHREDNLNHQKEGSVGFKSIFESLYRPSCSVKTSSYTTNSPSAVIGKQNQRIGDELNNEVCMIREICDQNASPVEELPDAFSADSRLQKNVKRDLVDGKSDGAIVAVSESSPSSVSKDGALESLWITRFLSKVPARPRPVSSGAESFVKPRRTEPVASSFAKRLDIVKGVKAKGSSNLATANSTCFFCGRDDNEKREC